MILRAALCLALSLGTAAKPPAKLKPAAPAKAASTVPVPGAAGERIDKASGRGRALGPFLESRAGFQATRCPDGRVLVTGGTLNTATSEWYDPASNRFSAGPALTRPRQGHRALLLRDGRLMVLGGTEAPAPAEVLEPGGTAFHALPEALFGLSAEAVELDDGKVLLVDGGTGALSSWDGRRPPSLRATLARPRVMFRALRLADGKVAILGGWPSEQKLRKGRPAGGPNLPVEVFNPRWSSLSSWSQTPLPRARLQAALLADGRICLWGGVGQDADQAVTEMELLDPAKETVSRAGSLDLEGGPCPAWAGQGLYLAERGQRLLACADPTLITQAMPAGQLANGYLDPVLVPLADGSVLVLGACAFGDPLERWDARSRQCAVLGTLRQGAQGISQLADGRVLVLGPVVDLLDPRSGTMTPLGWREELVPLLATARPALAAPAGAPPFRPGQARPDALVLALDKTRALVAGGSLDGEPSAAVDLWDLRRKALAASGPLKTRRARPAGLRLNDGSVLIWGPGKE